MLLLLLLLLLLLSEVVLQFLFLLVLLLRFRADRAKAREDAYARQLGVYDDRRGQDEQAGAGQAAELYTGASTRPDAEQGRR